MQAEERRTLGVWEPDGWSVCLAPGCAGASQSEDNLCVSHMSPDQLGDLLDGLQGAGHLDLRGTELKSGLLIEILRRIPCGDEDRFGLMLSQATIVGDCDLSGLSLPHVFESLGTHYTGKLSFNNSLLRTSIFDGAIFSATVTFREATFTGTSAFDQAEFNDTAQFDHVVVKGRLSLRDTKFKYVSFGNANLGDHFSLTGGSCESSFFREAVFGRRAYISDFGQSDASMYLADATFGDNAMLFLGSVANPLTSISLSRTTFGSNSTVLARAAEVICTGLRSEGGFRLDLDCETLDLAETVFAAPATISRRTGVQSLVQIETMQGTDCTNLTLDGLDLSRCRLGESYNLERLVVASHDSFVRAPGGWQFNLRAWPMLWRWSDRAIIVDEAQWRAAHHRGVKGMGWLNRSSASAKSHDPKRSPHEANGIVETYRALRKGREDRGDAPGAADFYYGEMEMRRRAASPKSIERVLLTVYWLLSGYSLRAWRAIVALACLIVLGAVCFLAFGFSNETRPAARPTSINLSTGAIAYGLAPSSDLPAGFGDAFIYSLQSTTSLLRSPPEHALTRWGQVQEVLMRFTGPALLGLFVLAVRGRVKR